MFDRLQPVRGLMRKRRLQGAIRVSDHFELPPVWGRQEPKRGQVIPRRG